MINYAIRYQPILREVARRQPAFVLDVGSGPEGLGMFWRGTVIGSDLAFKRRPLHRGVVASGEALPFAARGCPVVVSCDMLEHVPPPARHAAVVEMARVAGEALLLTFPSGQAAARVYEELARAWGSTSPPWLLEHLEHGLPEGEQVAGWLRDGGWQVTVTHFESAAAHAALLRWERRGPVKLLTYSLMRLAGPWLAPRWPIPSEGPTLRVFIRAERRPTTRTSDDVPFRCDDRRINAKTPRTLLLLRKRCE